MERFERYWSSGPSYSWIERVGERREELGIGQADTREDGEIERERVRDGDETEVTARAEVPIAGWIYI